jgi:hypothetical protein
MAKASRANRLRPSHLRVLQGGMRYALEKAEGRVTDRRKAGTLMRAAIAILLLLVALSGGLVVAVYLHVQSVLHSMVPLVAACTGLAALGAGLVAYALRFFGRGEHGLASGTENKDWSTDRHTGRMQRRCSRTGKMPDGGWLRGC